MRMLPANRLLANFPALLYFVSILFCLFVARPGLRLYAESHCIYHTYRVLLPGAAVNWGTKHSKRYENVASHSL